MRIAPFIISSVVTIGLVVALNTRFGTTPPAGKLLSPQHGFWKNAEPADADFNLEIKSAKLQDKVDVYLDDRLVPHVFAQNDHDAYFVQGFIHAKFRLWQMEFQTFAAAGRLSEIFGDSSNGRNWKKVDRFFRRMGMNMAAENSVKAMKNYPAAKNAIEAYTDGVNAYVENLQPENYPLEYKLLDYGPEKWSAQKTALFLKYMSYDLASDLDDFDYTNLLNSVGTGQLEKMFPIAADSLDPISPKGTPYATARPLPVKPANADSVYLTDTIQSVAMNMPDGPDPDNGSNNWIAGGSKTATGRPILCNDPHLGMNLPAIWFEMQIHTPEYNSYGASFPGSPAIVIGFNDSIAWGVTNAMRDVMDFYEIRFKDSTMNEYWFNNDWVKSEWRTETYRIRGQADFVDKIPVTVFGPVMYDASFANSSANGKAYAIRWAAHQGSVELATFMGLNRASNYNDYLEAIRGYQCPGQNFIFASKSNDIAWWQQAKFPAKWRRQGDFAMPGFDSSYMWQGDIPQEENVHMFNPERHFISSANQLPADTTYPFYLGGVHDVYRGIIINRYLRNKNNITVDDMKRMQTDNYNVFAEMARPVMLKYVREEDLTADAAGLLGELRNWNLRADPAEHGPTIFNTWWTCFADTVWNDNVRRKDGLKTPFPADQTLLEGILKDSAYAFVDDVSTPGVETLPQMLTAALNKAAGVLKSVPNIAWGTYKDTRVNHLLKIPALSRLHLDVGGGAKIINATKIDHGPSWRMIVHLTDETEAWGVYPGGQSGNPGSRFYDNFVSVWEQGQYNKLWVMKAAEKTSEQVKWQMHFKPA